MSDKPLYDWNEHKRVPLTALLAKMVYNQPWPLIYVHGNVHYFVPDRQALVGSKIEDGWLACIPVEKGYVVDPTDHGLVEFDRIEEEEAEVCRASAELLRKMIEADNAYA